MNPALITLLLLLGFHWCPLQGADEAPVHIDQELETLGDIFQCTIAMKRIKLPANSKHLLRINKNGKDTAQFELSDVNEVVLIACKGRGLGTSPRRMDEPEGIQIRILAYRPDGHDGYSVSYTIPAKSSRTRNPGLQLPILFQRDDLGDDGSLLGNLTITIDKPGEHGGGQPAPRPQPE